MYVSTAKQGLLVVAVHVLVLCGSHVLALPAVQTSALVVQSVTDLLNSSHTYCQQAEVSR